MDTHDRKPIPQSPPSALVTVPQRSARRATASRASDRRATARQHRDDAEGHIIEGRSSVEPDLYVNEDAVDAPPTEPWPVDHRVKSEAQVSGQDISSTITAELGDGPLRGLRLETCAIEGRPPSTVDVLADDGSTCRYCLAGWVQSGPSAAYSFLYRV
jgi:hypothetical protein